MCEFLERAGLRGTLTEEVREWSTMTHRVVELTRPFPTPDEMRFELWLHEESATAETRDLAATIAWAWSTAYWMLRLVMEVGA